MEISFIKYGYFLSLQENTYIILHRTRAVPASIRIFGLHPTTLLLRIGQHGNTHIYISYISVTISNI